MIQVKDRILHFLVAHPVASSSKLPKSVPTACFVQKCALMRSNKNQKKQVFFERLLFSSQFHKSQMSQSKICFMKSSNLWYIDMFSDFHQNKRFASPISPPTPSPSIWRCLKIGYRQKIQCCIIIFPLFLLEKDGIPHSPNPKMMLLPKEITEIALVSRSVFPSVDHPHPGL